MSSIRIRPRFKHQIETGKELLEKRICDALKKEEQFVFSHLPDHIYIRIDPKLRHFWSPQLHLTFEEIEDKVLIRGLYGPNPTVWSIFFFSYVVISIIALFLSMWGLSLLMMGKSALILWSLVPLGVIALLLYLASQAGQKFGAQQMFDIHHFYEQITHDKISIS